MISEYVKKAMDIDRRIKKVKVRGLKTRCLVWQGSVRTDDRKPVMFRGGKRVSVSKWLWEKNRGPVPEGKQLWQRCPTEKCVNWTDEHRGFKNG